jgi:hypothetical protein
MKVLKPLGFVLITCSLASTVALAQTPSPASADGTARATAGSVDAKHRFHPFGERRWNSAPDECVGPSGYCMPYFGS